MPEHLNANNLENSVTPIGKDAQFQMWTVEGVPKTSFKLPQNRGHDNWKY